MDNNQNNNFSIDENSFDETIGIFDSYYQNKKSDKITKKEDNEVSNTPSQTMKDIKDDFVPQESVQINNSAVSKSNTFDAVADNADKLSDESSVSSLSAEEKKKTSISISDSLETTNNANKSQLKNNPINTVDISYIYGIRESLKNNAKKEKNKNIIIAVVCGVFFFLFIPLCLMPVFIIKAIKVSKSISFSILCSSNRITWNPIENVTSYEIFYRSETSKLFTDLGEQTTCSFTGKGNGEYIVMAKNGSNVVSVSNTLKV